MEMEKIVVEVTGQKLIWYSHLRRMEKGRTSKVATEWMPWSSGINGLFVDKRIWTSTIDVSEGMG